MLKERRKRKQKRDQQIQQQNMQAQAQSNAQLAEQTALAETQKQQVITEQKIQLARAESDFEIQQMQQKGGQPASDDEMLEIERLTAQFVAEGLQQVKELSGQLSGAGAPDPLVQLKEQELQIRAQADQADQAIDQAKVQLDAQNQQMRSSQFDQRLASQERQTQARIDAAMQRELLKNQGG